MNGGIDLPRVPVIIHIVNERLIVARAYTNRGGIINLGMREGKLIDQTMGRHGNLSRLHGANCLKLTA